MDMNNENSEWPISPTFLSLRQGCTEESANYNTDGIFYTDYLRGFLADLSHDNRIKNALSLFQFVPEDFLPLDPNAEKTDEIPTQSEKGTVLHNKQMKPTIEYLLKSQKKKIIRIDSGTFVNNGKLCDAFRRCGEENTHFCFRQDSIVGIFADEELINFDPYANSGRKRLEEIIGNYKQGYEINVDDIEVNGKKRTYVHYTCPVSLFEEHIFPICVHGQIIACLMLGQMARENFCEKNAFSGYRDRMKSKSGEPINFETIEIVSCKERRDWEEKAHAIVERIQIFEGRLKERIEHRNTRYINDAFDTIEEMFRKEVKNINIREEGVSSQFSKVLNKAFSSIREIFDCSSDGFIRMFALPIDIEHDDLVPIGWSGAEFEANKNTTFSLKQLKGIERTLEIKDKNERIKEQRRIILNAASQDIRNRFDETKDFFLPGWLAGNEVAYIVWKRHSNTLRGKRNKQNFNIYRKILKNFYSIAQECYSYIRSARMELLLETTIQESTHESAHFILPVIDVVEKHMEMLPKEMVLPTYAIEYSKYIDSYERYKDEVLESLNQLWEINSGSSLIFASDIKIKKKNVEVFYLLYKLKKMLDNRAMDSHKYILYSQSYNYVEAHIDVTYFNHALYNLLDNAIKYGYEGSKIHINMDVDRKNSTLKVQVISYGIGIPKEDDNRVYNLFERGIEASQITRGTGIGMYIVQKVCKAHGGAISHNSKKLSDYNIPVLFNCKNRSSLLKKSSEEDISKYNDELARLSSGTIEQEVVYDTNFVRYAFVFSSRINMPTYKNTFCITIPLQ